MLHTIDESLPFLIECDASEVAISAVLNQGDWPVAFVSRALQKSELHYPSVEKEAMAIIEAVRKWRHFFSSRHFTLVTDQRSVAFMFDNRKRTKIKNNKIQDWLLEIASFSYSVDYRPGKDNAAPDSFTPRRNPCCSVSSWCDSHATFYEVKESPVFHGGSQKSLFSMQNLHTAQASVLPPTARSAH